MKTLVRAAALAIGLLLPACASSESGNAPRPATTGALTAGVIARVGGVDIRSATVGGIAAAQNIDLAIARELAIRDALFVAAALDSRLDADPDVAFSASIVLARSVLHDIQREAEARGDVTDDELAKATARRWLELDRPEAYSTIHAVVRFDDKADAALRRRAGKLADALRKAAVAACSDRSVRPIVADGGLIDPLALAFRAAVEAVPHDGLDVLVEELPTVAADGRIVAPDGGSFDPAFARAASALAERGDVSLPAVSSFGSHVILLLEKLPALTVPVAERRRLVREQVMLARQRAAEKQLLDKLRASVALELAVDSLLETVPVDR